MAEKSAKQLIEDTIEEIVQWYKDNPDAIFYKEFFHTQTSTSFKDFRQALSFYNDLQDRFALVEEMQEVRICKTGLIRRKGGDPSMAQYLLAKLHGYEDRNSKDDTSNPKDLRREVISRSVEQLKNLAVANQEITPKDIFDSLERDSEETLKELQDEEFKEEFEKKHGDFLKDE